MFFVGVLASGEVFRAWRLVVWHAKSNNIATTAKQQKPKRTICASKLKNPDS
jgi:hypothetical protein